MRRHIPWRRYVERVVAAASWTSTCSLFVIVERQRLKMDWIQGSNIAWLLIKPMKWNLQLGLRTEINVRIAPWLLSVSLFLPNRRKVSKVRKASHWNWESLAGMCSSSRSTMPWWIKTAQPDSEIQIQRSPLLSHLTLKQPWRTMDGYCRDRAQDCAFDASIWISDLLERVIPRPGLNNIGCKLSRKYNEQFIGTLSGAWHVPFAIK